MQPLEVKFDTSKGMTCENPTFNGSGIKLIAIPVGSGLYELDYSEVESMITFTCTICPMSFIITNDLFMQTAYNDPSGFITLDETARKMKIQSTTAQSK